MSAQESSTTNSYMCVMTVVETTQEILNSDIDFLAKFTSFLILCGINLANPLPLIHSSSK